MQREFLQALTVGDAPLPEALIDTILEQAAQDESAWQQKLDQTRSEHQAAMAKLQFDTLVKECVTQARGRNVKAITALLDMDALATAADPGQAISQAVNQLKRENSYLFETQPTPPPYAAGTGAQAQQTPHPQTLAGALRERFENK